MPLSLTAHVPLLPSIERVLRGPGSWVLGRHPDCEIRLEHDSISRRHARLTANDQDQWQIEDLQSKNGLRLDGARVSGARIEAETWVAVGDVFIALAPISEARADQRRHLTEQRRHATQQRPIRSSANDSASEVLQAILQQLLTISECQRGLLLDIQQEQPGQVMVSLGFGADADRGFAGSVGALQQALNTRSPVFMSASQDPAQLSQRASVLRAGITAVAALPLLDLDGRVVALAYLDSQTPGRHFSEIDAELLQAFAERAASELALCLLEHRLNTLAAGLA